MGGREGIQFHVHSLTYSKYFFVRRNNVFIDNVCLKHKKILNKADRFKQVGLHHKITVGRGKKVHVMFL